MGEPGNRMLKAVGDWLFGHKYNLATAALGTAALIAAGTNSRIAVSVMALAVLPSLWIKAKTPVVATVPEMLVPEPEPLADVKAAFAGFDSPAYLLDPKANVIYQNPSARHAFGAIEPGQHISARIRLPAIMDMIRETIASGRNGQTEYAETLPTESVYQVRMIPARDGQGVIGFYVLIFRDISESRRIDRMRSDFVANASHELRTPLASLRGFIETLLGPARNDPATNGS